MTDTDKRADRPAPEPVQRRIRLRIDAKRAAELVDRIRGDHDEPFGRLERVRTVIRPKGPVPG